jgi:hypothetical protein
LHPPVKTVQASFSGKSSRVVFCKPLIIIFGSPCVIVDLDVLFVNKVRKHLIFAFFRVKIIKR